MWDDHWARLMSRAAFHASAEESQPAECITGESNTSSQEGSLLLPNALQCMHPASLYEEVKRLQVTCLVDDDDKDWVTVPVRRPPAHPSPGEALRSSRAETQTAGRRSRRHCRGKARDAKFGKMNLSSETVANGV